jgi:hypothetical protein
LEELQGLYVVIRKAYIQRACIISGREKGGKKLSLPPLLAADFPGGGRGGGGI